MFILKNGHQPGVYVPLRALFLVFDTIDEIVLMFNYDMCYGINVYIYVQL